MKAINVKTLKFKWPNKKNHIDVPIYGGAFYFCTDRDEYAQIGEFLMSDQTFGEGVGMCLGCVTPLINECGGAVYMIGVFDGSYGTLCHEIGHLALFILDRAGVPVDSQNSEAFCYLQGHLFDVCQPLLDDANMKELEAQIAAEEVDEEPVPEPVKELVEALKGSKSAPEQRKGKGGRRGRS